MGGGKPPGNGEGGEPPGIERGIWGEAAKLQAREERGEGVERTSRPGQNRGTRRE